MGWLRVVIRVGVLWVASIVVAVVGLELAHRMTVAIARGTEAEAIGGRSPAVLSMTHTMSPHARTERKRR
jgi:hypothetical protein